MKRIEQRGAMVGSLWSVPNRTDGNVIAYRVVKNRRAMSALLQFAHYDIGVVDVTAVCLAHIMLLPTRAIECHFSAPSDLASPGPLILTTNAFRWHPSSDDVITGAINSKAFPLLDAEVRGSLRMSLRILIRCGVKIHSCVSRPNSTVKLFAQTECK